MLSFDEFRAVNKREKGKAELAKKVESTTTTASSGDGKQKSIEPQQEKKKVTSATEMLGNVLELQSTQTLYIILLILDTFAAMAELGILSNQIPSKYMPGVITQLLQGLKLFS